MTTTMFEPSLSTSGMRAPFASADAPSMADSLPNINFGFDDLRERMAKFTARFDEFIEHGRKRVLEERNQFRMNLAELQEDQRMKKKDIEILTLKTATHQQTLQKEAAETAEMHSAIATITVQRDERAAARNRLREQIAETQCLIVARQEGQRKHAQHLDSQARFNAPELDFWQDHLCVSIEGAGRADHLKFVFTHLDDRNWEREAWVELSVGKREYEVLHVRPKLAKEVVEKAIDQLNETRSLGVFLKMLREAFVAAMK